MIDSGLLDWCGQGRQRLSISGSIRCEASTNDVFIRTSDALVLMNESLVCVNDAFVRTKGGQRAQGTDHRALHNLDES